MASINIKKTNPSKYREIVNRLSNYGEIAKCISETSVSRNTIRSIVTAGIADEENIDKVYDYVSNRNKELTAA